MKLMIASDLHGSGYFCEKLIECYRAENADRLILLGDILYHGPRNDLPRGYDPKTVMALLNPLAEQIACVRGNCDAEVDQMVLEFTLAEDFLTIRENGRDALLAHGHRLSPQNLPALPVGSLFISGHTHVPGHVEKNGVLCLNPGSVSIPKEESPHSYLIWEDNTLLWKDLDGAVYDQLEIAR